MFLDDIPVLGALRAKMSWLTERQKVLAQNVANADTPGFQSRDLDKDGFKKALVSHVNETARTGRHKRHIAFRDTQPSAFKPIVEKSDWETTPDGNSVVLEEQMMKVAQTQMEYQSAIGLYRKSLDMLKIAVRSR